jgi:hypothetical protein
MPVGCFWSDSDEMRAADAAANCQPVGVDEQDLTELLELQRLTRELLDHLTAMFLVEAAGDLLRAMADELDGLVDLDQSDLNATSVADSVMRRCNRLQVPQRMELQNRQA